MEDRALIVDSDDIVDLDNFKFRFKNKRMWDDEGFLYRKSRRLNRVQIFFKYVCNFPSGCWNSCVSKCKRRKEYFARVVTIGRAPRVQKFPSNAINNQKYNLITFLPLVLFEQFSVFLNMIFLIMACSQFIPTLKIGYLYTYWGPLGFVVFVTLCREAIDDIRRWLRDREVNMTQYTKVFKNGDKRSITSAKIEVGDIIIVEKNQRVPADMILLQTNEKQGTCFIRTDQLDGETDWKLRIADPTTQALETPENIFKIQAQIYAERPNKSIHSFEGSFSRTDGIEAEDPLSVENTLWSNTVLANGRSVGIVIYTGVETRAVMNSSQPRSKFGLIDEEINNLTKLLFVTTIILSFVMLILKGFSGSWYKYLWRFFLLFSYIIPLALRVNLDLAKIVSAFVIMRDKDIPEVIVRTTTIPEELGRISYLMSDKTGTLTQNEMMFRKLHLGTVSYGADSMDEVADQLRSFYESGAKMPPADTKVRKTGGIRVLEAVQAIALCHNVTPVRELIEDTESAVEVAGESPEGSTQMNEFREKVSYQASSPDEVALVMWTETVGLTLISRDLSSIQLRTANGLVLSYEILQVFPFTSETRRMGIMIRDKQSGEIAFYVKGADAVMGPMVTYADWLDEETGNMAREGLRTLVVAKKVLSEEQYADFASRYHQAKMSLTDRAGKVAATLATVEMDLELLCLTGVEDKLQEAVRPTLETLRNAGIRVWMLTGDKLETAECIAKSSRLVARNQTLHIFQPVSGRAEAHLELNSFRKRSESALVITGQSLQTCLEFYECEFMELAIQCPAVVVCRCSPTQKADIVRLLKAHTGLRIASIGDGGNDVSMIQAADVGIGIVGKEGRQASLASDFSLNQFSHIAKLFLVHGRNTYKNTSTLSQFIIHRGMIISVMQAIFSAIFYFVAIPLFPGFLMVGYATVFTMFPVFSLVLDKDVSDKVALTYPELYKSLTKGRDLNFKTFFIWVLISIYQGGIIMYGAILLFEDDFVHVVSITFTSLVLTELLMVALTIRTWKLLMVLAEVFSLLIYVVALMVLNEYFDPYFLKTWNFVWKVASITAVSCIPLFILKYIRYKLRPPIHTKLQDN